MGEMNKISCRSCGKSWEYRSGCGIRHSSLKEVARVFEDTVAQQFLQYANENPFCIFHFSYMAAQCSECTNIVEVPFLELNAGRYKGACPLCGHKVEVITEIDNLKCPICGETDFEQSTIGHWD